MFGKLNDEEIERVLHQQFLGRIGCHHKDVTYVVPISYAYDGTYIYCHTRDGMKIKMMRENPKVCFEVDSLTNMANWQSVIAWGKFEELTVGEDRNAALKCLVERILPVISSETTHLSAQWPFPPNNFEEIRGIVFRIKLETKTGRFEKNEHIPLSSFS